MSYEEYSRPELRIGIDEHSFKELMLDSVCTEFRAEVWWTELEGILELMDVQPSHASFLSLSDGFEKLIIFLSLYHFHGIVSPTKSFLFLSFCVQATGHMIVLLEMRRFMCWSSVDYILVLGTR